MNDRDFYAWQETWDKVPEGTPHGWIQWKGTDVCLDFHCACGSHLHFDTYFLYAVRCLDCQRMYTVGAHVQVREIPKRFVDAGLVVCIKEASKDDD